MYNTTIFSMLTDAGLKILCDMWVLENYKLNNTLQEKVPKKQVLASRAQSRS